MEEVSKSLEDSKWNNLLAENLTLYNTKIISKFRDEMLLERKNILQEYASTSNEPDDMLYIYNSSSNDKSAYNLCYCDSEKNDVLTVKINDLPKGSELGSILVKRENGYILDDNASKIVNKEINDMIKEKIKEQSEYLDSKRIEGHIYEVGEKYSGIIGLYDLTNKSQGMEEIEEIDFPEELYKTASEGDMYIYQNGEYVIKE